MKRLLGLLLLLGAAAPALAFTCKDKNGDPCPGAGRPNTYTLSSPDNLSSSSDIQLAENAAQGGDTIKISADGTWNRPLLVTKQIEIMGTTGTISSGTLVQIALTGTPVAAFDVNTDATDTTHRLQIHNLDILGFASAAKVHIDGYLAVQPGSASGFRIHDVHFHLPYAIDGDLPDKTLSGTASFPSGSNTITMSVAHGLTAADKGRAIFCTGIPTGAIVQSFTTNTITTTDNNNNAAGTTAVKSTSAQSAASVTIAEHLGTFGVDGVIGHGGYSNAGWLRTTGWVEGVVDHCDIDGNPMIYASQHGIPNKDGSPRLPEGSDQWGDYSWFYKPNDGAQAPNMAGTIHLVDIEDCNVHDGGGAAVDSNSTGQYGGGGATVLDRHNTRTNSFGEHGSRDSGGRLGGGRLTESYNVHWILMSDTLQAKTDLTAWEIRSGEHVHFNDYMTIGPGQTFATSTAAQFAGNVNCAAYGSMNGGISKGPTGSGAGFDWGADGLNVNDLNQKGNWTGFDAAGTQHVPYADYSNTQAASGNDINTTDPSQADTVNSGLDTDQRFGDVYGIVTGGSLNADENAPVLTNVTITGTNFPVGTNAIPANFFRGTVLRNPSVRRSLGGDITEKFICFLQVVGSTQANSSVVSGTKTQATGVTLTMLQSRITTKSLPLKYDGVGGMELRRVISFMQVAGHGSMHALLGGAPAAPTDGSTPRYLGTDPSMSPPYNVPEAGIHIWATKRRLAGASTWSSVVTPGACLPGGIYEHIIPEWHEYNGDAQNVIPSNKTFPDSTPSPQGMQTLFDRGYKWNPRVIANCNSAASCADKSQLVGADWGKQYTDHGRVLFDSSAGNYASFPLPSVTINGTAYVGVGGNLQYPHPFIATPTPAPPQITSTPAATWTASQANTFKVTTNGSPVPTFTPAPTPKPAFMTFTDNGDGTATMSGTPAASPSSYNFTITAHNSAGSDDTQSFALTITSPTCTLTAPNDGDNFPAPASISFAATAQSSSTITKVDFLNGSTVVATDNTSAGPNYSASWSPVSAGTYTVKARATQTGGSTFNSDTATITVSAVSPTATPAAIQIIP